MQPAFGLSIPETLEDVCDPARLVLVVYDMRVGSSIRSRMAPRSPAKFFKISKAHARPEFVFSLPGNVRAQGTHGNLQLRMAMAWQPVTSVEEVKP